MREIADPKKNDALPNPNAEQQAFPSDESLSPEVAHVKKKILRLMVVSISSTILLILAVLTGIVYKVITHTPPHTKGRGFPPQSDYSVPAHHTLSFPKGTKILSQSLSEPHIALHIMLPNSETKLMIYNYYTGALITVFSVHEAKENTLRSPLEEHKREKR